MIRRKKQVTSFYLIRNGRLLRLTADVAAHAIEGFSEDLDELLLQTNDGRHEHDHHQKIAADTQASKHGETLQERRVGEEERKRERKREREKERERKRVTERERVTE